MQPRIAALSCVIVVTDDPPSAPVVRALLSTLSQQGEA